MAVAQHAKKANNSPPQPLPEGGNLTVEVPWWDWIANFNDDEWNYLLAYVHRVSPMCDRKAAGKPVAIAKLQRRFDLDDILKEFGSGHYRFDVVRRNPRPGPGEKIQERIRQEYVSIINTDFPPRVPLGDWMNDPENEMWKWAEEPLKLQRAQANARIKTFEDLPAGTNGGNNSAEIFNTILEGVKTLRPAESDTAGLAGQLLQIVMNNQQAMQALNDPAKQLATLKNLLDTLQPAQRDPDASTMMLEFMKDQVSALREELKEMRLAGQGKSFTDQLKEFTTVFTEVAPSLGFNKRGAPNPNPGSGGTDWGNVIEKILDKGQAYVPAIVAMMQRAGNGAAPAQPGWSPTVQPAIAAVQPQQQQQPNPPAQPEAPTMPLTAEQTEAMKQLETKMQACWTKHQAFIQQVIPFVVDRFRAKETGYDLRDWFLDRYGRLVWTQFRDDSGPEVLTTLAGLHPYLKTVLGPPELVLVYFQEFFTEPGQEPPGSVVDEPDDDGEEGDHAA